MKNLLSACHSIVNSIAAICEYLSWFILLGWVGLMTVGVVMRYVFSAPLLFQGEVVSGLLVVFCSLSFANILIRDQHIKVDLIIRHLGPRTQTFLLGFSYLVALLFSILMIWASKNLIYISLMMGTKFDVSGIVLWPFQVAFVFGFILLACASLVRFLELLTDTSNAELDQNTAESA